MNSSRRTDVNIGSQIMGKTEVRYKEETIHLNDYEYHQQQILMENAEFLPLKRKHRETSDDTRNYLTEDHTREMTRLSMWGLSHKILREQLKSTIKW